ncbi:tyrosine-type recombinase/integrase [Planctomycetota bacterium]
MGHIYKKKTLKPIPEGAEIIYSKRGKVRVKLARWTDKQGHKHTTEVHKDGQRIIIESRVWYCQYRDSSGVVRRESTGCNHEDNAREVLKERVSLVEKVKKRIVSHEEVKIGTHANTPLSTHVDDYLLALSNKTVKGRRVSPEHVANVKRQLDLIQEECGFRWVVDINRDALARWMAKRIKDNVMSNRTVNTYRSACMAFCKWCVESGRMLTHPLEGLTTAENVESKPRRALNIDELAKLFQATRIRPLIEARTIRRGPRKGQPLAKVKPEVEQRLIRTGQERELLYRVMAFTGLRKKEVASLTVRDLRLDQEHPYISLTAHSAKNVKADEIPLKAELAGTLKEWISNKLPTAKVFFVPQNLVSSFDKDCEFAEIPKTVDGEVACVHSLRHSFASMLAQAGVSPQKATRLLRHSSLDLTMQRYTHIEMIDKTQAIAALPDITDIASEAAQATGTDGGELEVTKKVTSSRQKLRIDGKNGQDEQNQDDQPSLLKGRFSANNGDNKKSGWGESNSHDQLGRLQGWNS